MRLTRISSKIRIRSRAPVWEVRGGYEFLQIYIFSPVDGLSKRYRSWGNVDDAFVCTHFTQVGGEAPLSVYIFFWCTNCKLVTWLHQDFIFQCSNLAHQIGQKILYNLEEKNQLNRTIFTGFMPVLSFAQMLIYIIVLFEK